MVNAPARLIPPSLATSTEAASQAAARTAAYPAYLPKISTVPT
ncbi:MAG: hypothetical protein QOE15_1041, partial [Acidimicrobiaceae bacterium]|nr:hypothetical protein [Acidimicrobiaceae bacterium]